MQAASCIGNVAQHDQALPRTGQHCAWHWSGLAADTIFSCS